MNMYHLLHGYDVGIDLGDERARVWVKGKGLVFDEPIDGGWRINQQYEVLVILKRCLSAVPRSLRSPRVLLSMPSMICSASTQKYYQEVKRRAGVRELLLVESAMTAAIGANLPVTEPVGNMIVNIGARTADIALIAMAGVVCSSTVGVSREEAERDRMAFEKSILSGVMNFLETAPPELAADIVDRGIMLTGRWLLMPELDKKIADMSKLPVKSVCEPECATIRGVATVLDSIDELLPVWWKKWNEQEAKAKQKLERQEATRSLLAPDGRDLVNWIRDIDDRVRRLESRQEDV